MDALEIMEHAFFDELEKIGMEKEALVPAGAIKALGKGFQLGTAGKYMGARVGGGAALGAGANVLMGDQNKSLMQRAVGGGLAGGLAGGAGAAGATAWRLGRLANASRVGAGMSRAQQLSAIKGLRSAGFSSRGAGLTGGKTVRTVGGKEVTITRPARGATDVGGIGGWQRAWR